VRNQLTDDVDVLTTSQAAKLLGISVRTAQLWIESGSLRSWKTPGGHRRVYRSEVMALINRSRAAPGVSAALPQLAARDAAKAPTASDETGRLVALERSGLVDSAPERSFDRLTWLASKTLHMPVSLVTLLTSTRQWFKSRQGLEMTETPRDWSFCNRTILQRDVFTVEDLMLDPQFAHNPAVTGTPYFRFYAGAPVIDPEGFALGAMCVIDYKPRVLNDDERTALFALAEIASDEIRLRAAERQLQVLGASINS
jgi:excisionase family DNA binding protein